MGITNWQKSKDFLNAIGVNAIDVPKDIFQSLKEIGLKSKTVKYNKNLVGHIKEEYEILNYTPDIKNFIEKQVSANPVYANINRKYNANKHSSPIVLDRIWINFQNKYEFNPLHDHSGCASFIIFVNIPYNLEDEENYFAETNPNADIYTSKLCFLNMFNDGSFMHKPLDVDKSFEGKMLMFRNDQYHCVYPFYTSDDKRITIAGNLCFNNENYNIQRS